MDWDNKVDALPSIALGEVVDLKTHIWLYYFQVTAIKSLLKVSSPKIVHLILPQL